MLTPDAIAERWYALTLETYPAETQPFLRDERDPFRNPVAATIRTSIAVLADELLGNMRQDRVKAALLDIIRIRAVQDFPASTAVGFVFLLKDVLGECGKEFPALAARTWGTGLAPEIDKRVDELALVAFDVYMGCREQIAMLRVKDAARQRAMSRMEPCEP
jgi:alkylhydroperoxidase/carboxymuconolactone decarboxylase family protein YurZ